MSLQRKVGMPQRTTSLARASAGLSPISKKRRTAMAKQNKVLPLAAHCLACGSSYQLTRSHILTQKQAPAERANPLNVVTLCWTCHSTWENKKALFAATYPDAYAEKLARMQELAPQYYAFFLTKHPAPLLRELP